MQLCLVVAVFVSWLSVDFAPTGVPEWIAWKLSAVLMCQIVVVLAAWATTTMALAELNSQLYPTEVVVQRYVGRLRWQHALWICFFVCSVACFDLVRVVTQLIESASSMGGMPALAGFPLIVRLCVTLPMLVSLVVSWSFSFDVEQQLDPGLKKRLTNATRLGHVLANFRSTLLVPLVTAVAVSGWIESVNYFWPWLAESNWSTLIHSLPLWLLALWLPTLLVRLWKTTSLADGVLRRRLQRQTAESGISIRDIVIWDTGGRLSNAAVTGFVPGSRRLLLTDRLLRDLSPDEIELVVMHEIGHVKHGHNSKMLLAIVGSMAAVFAFFWAFGNLPTGSRLTLALGVPVTIGMSCWLVCSYARLLELQADLWAVGKSGDSLAYLRVIGGMAGGGPDDADWLHPSFACRCKFLANGPASAAVRLQSQLRLSSLVLTGWIVGSLLFSAILAVC